MTINISIPEHAIRHDFSLDGSIYGLRKGVAGPATWTRPMGGWLMTYGKLHEDGTVTETVDREGHVVEAARELGHIDWKPYLKGSRWNDTHDENVIVGLRTHLSFHDATSSLAKAHGKVGFWTEGRLFDRTDSKSWEGLGRVPTPHEFDRADFFFNLSGLLKGSPRPLGLSAHGVMALSECKTRIVYCQVAQAAVCQLPMNPDATFEQMIKAVRPVQYDSPLKILRKGMATRGPCGRCSCEAGACDKLRKAIHSGNLGGVVPEDLESGISSPEIDADADAEDDDESTDQSITDRLIDNIQRRFEVPRGQAIRWVRDYIARERANQGEGQNVPENQ